MMKFKSIFKPAAAVLAAAIALASCEVDTTTVMFEEDHNFSDPTIANNDDYLCDETFIWALEKSGMMDKEHITVSDDDMKEISVTNLFSLFRVVSLVSNLPDDMNFNKEK